MVEITFLLPAFNEEDTIENVIGQLDGLRREFRDSEILVVNDGSTDRTGSILKKTMQKVNSLRIVTHSQNKGLGAALYTGFKQARGKIIVTMDADLSHDTSLVKKLVGGLREGNSVVIASRYTPGGRMVGVPLYRVIVSAFANFVFSKLFDLKVKDATSGYRAYDQRVVKDIRVESHGFSAQLEILIKIRKKASNFKEVPLILSMRKIGYSKFRLFDVFLSYLKLMYIIVIPHE